MLLPPPPRQHMVALGGLRLTPGSRGQEAVPLRFRPLFLGVSVLQVTGLYTLAITVAAQVGHSTGHQPPRTDGGGARLAD